MKAFEWANAASVDDAVKLLGADPKADPDAMPRPIGGGQDLHTTMKAYITRPSRVVNLKTVAGLNGIAATPDGGVRIGALVTLTQLIADPTVAKLYPGLAEAAHAVATPQIRNLGTVGGNLGQRPRCWYFRLDGVTCLKKGGTECYAKEGENKYHAILATDGPCVIVHPSDLAPMLAALGATVAVTGPGGERTMPVEKLFHLPADNVRTETVLGDGDVITEVRLPPPAGRSTYVKIKERESLDFAMSSVAAVATAGGGAKLVLGGVAPVPWRCDKAEAFLAGKPLTEEAIAHAATLAVDGAKPLAKNGYKVPLTQTLVRRALAKLA